ncbi:ATP-binding protein [Trichothermofontia sp.]
MRGTLCCLPVSLKPSMPCLPIARLTYPVALCSPETEPSVLLTQCLQAETSFGVVLDAQQHPVGVVRLHRLLSLAPFPGSLLGLMSGVATEALPIAATTLIEPVGLLSASLSLAELCEQLARRESGHWAIVDAQGQFLGLLNSERALSWLASQWGESLPRTYTSPLATWAPGFSAPSVAPCLVSDSPDGSAMLAVPQGRSGCDLAESYQSVGTDTLPPLTVPPTVPPMVSERSTLPLDWQWLDWLPLPLRLQTETGVVWGQNRAWSQVIGDRSDWPLEGLVPPSDRARSLAFSSQPSSPTVCVTPTPRMGSQMGDGGTLATHTEKIWQFIYLPLPSMSHRMDVSYPGAMEAAGGAAQSWEEGESNLRLGLLAAIDVTPIYAQNQSLLAENQALWQQNQAKNEFLMSLSHDIKNPLTAILGLASLMQTTTVGPLNARQHQYIQLIHHNARLLTTLASQSFELACLDAGQLTLNCKPVDLRAVCERAIAQAQALYAAQLSHAESPHLTDPTDSSDPSLGAATRVIHQSWEIDVETECLVADELRLCQMLTHLLSNALKFSSPTDPVGVRISRWHPDWLALTVWDRGIGIPVTEQPRLFQKLQRLQFAHNPYPGGIGMGLALTDRLVRLHGGVISFLSEEGVGSEFTLLLPASNPRWSVPQSARSGEEAAIAPTSTIVLVAVAPSQGQELIEALHALGYRVVVARFPQDLLEKARCLHPSVIFLDESGLMDTAASLLARLKADPETAHIPVIGTVSRSTATSSLKTQVDGIVSLPTPTSLLQSWFEYLAILRRGEGAGVPPPAKVSAQVPTKSLTLLSLSQLLPDLPVAGATISASLGKLPINLSHLLYQNQHRLLEADDLDQAALLATVWQPDLLLVRGDTLADPAHYFAQIQAYPELASRAIVALNCTDVTAWMPTVSLRIFPYDLSQMADVAHFWAYLHQIAVNHPPLTKSLPLPPDAG